MLLLRGISEVAAHGWAPVCYSLSSNLTRFPDLVDLTSIQLNQPCPDQFNLPDADLVLSWESATVNVDLPENAVPALDFDLEYGTRFLPVYDNETSVGPIG